MAYKTEICAFVCVDMVAMATPLAPLNIQVVYFNSSTLYAKLLDHVGL